MKDLSKKLHKKIEKLQDGKLELHEIEELVEDAQELYERLVIVKFKAYEKFGSPKKEKKEKAAPVEVEDKIEAPVKEEPKAAEPAVEDKKDEKVKEATEDAFDFTNVTEEVEQPAFDFSASEETSEEDNSSEEEAFPEDADIKNVAPKETEEESDTFPEDEEIKTSKQDIFKDSHVEKHEPEDENSLNQQLGDEEETDLSLRKKLQSTPVKDLKAEISLAKKFEYITFMFEGNNDNYEAAIEILNSCSDGEEAKNKLNEYSTKYNWDLENKSIIKFVELVERRYL